MVFETKDLVSTAENCPRGWDGCICTLQLRVLDL